MSESSSIARILRHPIASAESRESTALLIGGGAFVVGAITGVIFFWGREVPISGRGSSGDFVAIGGAVIAIAAFQFGCVLRRSRGREDPLGSHVSRAFTGSMWRP